MADVSGDIAANYTRIRARVAELNPSAILVAVSKTKPIDDLRAAFNAGCHIFGENYVDEIVTKSPLIPDAQFHFIGHLQSNKVAKLCRCPNLAMIQTIDSASLASKVNKAWATDRPPLPVLIQVNTSEEPQKGGIIHSDESLIGLIRHISNQCPRLKFAGVMTIGESGESRRDFETLIQVRQKIVREIGVSESDVALSMGMSGDYELALELGSTIVRVGSSIFGARTVHQ
jgi:pyridoxal phosphate enzyme (YggS family)